MIDPEHHRRLERMYVSAPVTQWYGAAIGISDGAAEVRVETRPEFLHAAHGVHGSVYFRLLDDAAFFAVNSRVLEVFVLTVSFTVQFARPVSSGLLRARGRVLHGGGRLFFAESDLIDANGDLLGHGSGVFSRSAIPLDARVGYA
ncbi:MAG TPA: PaaI family thioesterase [Candidatus Polarisedimenticolia bacterium]|nr:PaaI family thioesterase [Candidatus Polarisedimenticolia bacterium]